MGPRDENCPNASSMKKRGTPQISNMMAYGIKKAPKTQIIHEIQIMNRKGVFWYYSVFNKNSVIQQLGCSRWSDGLHFISIFAYFYYIDASNRVFKTYLLRSCKLDMGISTHFRARQHIRHMIEEILSFLPMFHEPPPQS